MQKIGENEWFKHTFGSTNHSNGGEIDTHNCKFYDRIKDLFLFFLNLWKLYFKYCIEQEKYCNPIKLKENNIKSKSHIEELLKLN